MHNSVDVNVNVNVVYTLKQEVLRGRRQAALSLINASVLRAENNMICFSVIGQSLSQTKIG